MRCPLCQSRVARRQCPAVDHQICAVCCGTKRRVEIRCPDTCGYLNNAQAHPHAALRRQQERDAALVMPALAGLSEPQQQLFLLTLTLIDRFKGDGLEAATDADVADAAGALARTFDTAARGLIYEQRAATLPAQRIAGEIRKVFDELGRRHPTGFAADAARVLRRIEERVAEAHQEGVDARRGFIDLAGRLAAQFGSAAPEAPEPSPIILP